MAIFDGIFILWEVSSLLFYSKTRSSFTVFAYVLQHNYHYNFVLIISSDMQYSVFDPIFLFFLLQILKQVDN